MDGKEPPASGQEEGHAQPPAPQAAGGEAAAAAPAAAPLFHANAPPPVVAAAPVDANEEALWRNLLTQLASLDAEATAAMHVALQASALCAALQQRNAALRAQLLNVHEPAWHAVAGAGAAAHGAQLQPYGAAQGAAAAAVDGAAASGSDDDDDAHFAAACAAAVAAGLPAEPSYVSDAEADSV
jgi:hypothetical protein